MLRFSLQPQELNLRGYLRQSLQEREFTCRGYPFYKEALITDLMSSWDRHTPDLQEVPYKDDLFGSTLFYKGALILNCRFSLQAGKFGYRYSMWEDGVYEDGGNEIEG